MEVYPETPPLLVDDFLRRRCLRCHIHVKGQQGRGLYRASGCAACHVLYDNDGKYEGGDEALKNSSAGYPKRHEFTKDIPTWQCLHCHNQNHVGTDFEGMFEGDYSLTYRVPELHGESSKVIYGMGYHNLSKDIHAERGMWCVDCHRKKDVMGDGRAYDFQMAVPRITCADCHGGFLSPMPHVKKLASQSAKFIYEEGSLKNENRPIDGPVFFMKRGGGKPVQIPLFNQSSPAHHIKEHSRVRCSACHAQWSFQDYGLSVIREDVTEGRKWIKLRFQGDLELEKILTDRLIGTKGDILSRDRISGRCISI
jgi:hypothetical protein